MNSGVVLMTAGMSPVAAAAFMIVAAASMSF